MSRAAAAGQPGRQPDTTAAAGRPELSGGGSPVTPARTRPPHRAPGRCTPRAALAAALARRLRHHTGSLAAAVTDLGTGVTATYHPRQAFPTASIVKAGILAALL
jgi:beta-lactamase class A